ncbi:MAG: uroporphyrinogen-III synthase [Nitrososphaeria archaeon]
MAAIVPLSTRRFARWLSGELGSPPVLAVPALRVVPTAPPPEVEAAARLGLPAVVTSPNAVDVMASILPRELLRAALSRSIAIGPMTAEAIAEAVPGARVEVPPTHSSRSLLSVLGPGPRVLWCSEGVEESLARAVEASGGAVVRLYRVEADRGALGRIRSALSDGDVVVFASLSSVEAWGLLREGLAARPRGAAVSRRVAAPLRGDPSLSSLAAFEGGDIRRFPQFLRALAGGGA